MPTPANSINEATTGIVGFTGTAFTGTAVTQHDVLLGGSTSSTLTNVAPSATSGVPLVSNGASADPSFTTAVVAGGGTGSTSFNINGPVISSTTTTGALTSITLTNQKFLVGNTSAAPTAKALSVVIQTFTTNGTYTPTSGMVYCIIECVGGGGGGGGAAGTAGALSSGSGGGGGEYANGVFSSATIGASQTVTIGAAGAANSAASGGNGGDTSVGALISAKGGTGGTVVTTAGGSAGVFSTPGGAGGSGGSGGSYRFNGSTGGTGWNTNFASGQNCIGGAGKAGRFNGDTRDIIVTNNAVAQSTAGITATGFGGGGGGGINYVNSTAVAGGAGTAGLVVVTEYVIS